MKLFRMNLIIRFLSFVSILLVLTLSSCQQENRPEIITINIDFSSPGRMFEGIGAVSAGASSRLLIDYPEPYRSHILDYLFKPGFGAAFTYLKVEIGGDGNSTCGSEPSFARTSGELNSPNYLRGYEYWLMKEAVRRNEHIELDALQWSMPGWFKDQQVWSQDNADYIACFLKGARDFWNLNMTHIAGSWNERHYDRDWIVNVHRPTLDRNGFSALKIVGPDGCVHSDTYDRIISDEQFKSTICAVSEHYMVSYMFNDNPADSARIKSAIATGIPIWSGEDFSLSGKPWDYTLYMAGNIIKSYLRQKAVRVNFWCPVAAMADNACFSNTGIMKAAEPWSGYYEVWPAIWGVAHFTQFIKPGWYFVESGCGTLTGDGVYATYRNEDDSGFTVVVVNGSEEQTVDFRYQMLPDQPLHVWQSDEQEQFVKVSEIIPVNGSFALKLLPRTIYSITTTTGQMKGCHPVPERTAFGSNYFEDFDSYSMSEAPLTAKYIWDNSGSFEISRDGNGNQFLRQMVNSAIIGWIPDKCAQAFLAQGREWEDGEITAEVFVEENAFNGTGYAGILIRGSYNRHLQSDIPHGYMLNVYHDGTWRLLAKEKVLAQGETAGNVWNRLKLSAEGENIKACVNNKLVATLYDQNYSLGAAGLVSGWNHARFDNLQVNFSPPDGVLVSEWKIASASSEPVNRFQTVRQAFDGNSLSGWKAGHSNGPQWLQVDLGDLYEIVRIETYTDSAAYVHKYRIDCSTDGQNWSLFSDKTNNSVPRIPCYIDKKEAKARYVRVTFEDTKGVLPCVYAFNVYRKD
jgi:galactosylceramidase